MLRALLCPIPLWLLGTSLVHRVGKVCADITWQQFGESRELYKGLMSRDQPPSRFICSPIFISNVSYIPIRKL